MPKEIIWRWGPLSRCINPATGYRLVWVMLLTVCVLLTSLSLGKVILTPWQVLDILASAETGGVHFIVEQLRLPRTLMAWLVGAALAISGLILQSIVRNPLASPDLLGVTSGASAAAVFYLAFFSKRKYFSKLRRKIFYKRKIFINFIFFTNFYYYYFKFNFSCLNYLRSFIVFPIL